MIEHITLEDANALAAHEAEDTSNIWRQHWLMWGTHYEVLFRLLFARTSALLVRNMELEAHLKALEEQLKGGK